MTFGSYCSGPPTFPDPVSPNAPILLHESEPTHLLLVHGTELRHPRMRLILPAGKRGPRTAFQPLRHAHRYLLSVMLRASSRNLLQKQRATSQLRWECQVYYSKWLGGKDDYSAQPPQYSSMQVGSCGVTISWHAFTLHLHMYEPWNHEDG